MVAFAVVVGRHAIRSNVFWKGVVWGVTLVVVALQLSRSILLSEWNGSIIDNMNMDISSNDFDRPTTTTEGGSSSWPSSSSISEEALPTIALPYSRSVGTTTAKVHSESKANVRRKVGESHNNMPHQCQCSFHNNSTRTTFASDPCSHAYDGSKNKNQTPPPLEAWLQRQQPDRRLSKHRPACPQAARHHLHIVIPFSGISLTTLQAALCSVQCQDYPSHKMSVYVYEDGVDNHQNSSVLATTNLCDHPILTFQPPPLSTTTSDDEFDALAQTVASKALQEYHDSQGATRHLNTPPTHSTSHTNTICIQSQDHLGPGGAKYWALQLVQAATAHTSVNDIVVVLDGDDAFYTDQALAVINQKYMDSNVWVTYGSHVGKYAEQTQPLPKSLRQQKNVSFQPRQNKPSWRFGHPRTFKAHLLSHLGRRDFTYQHPTANTTTWLVQATDRGFVYRTLELAGIDRVGYISDPIYQYNWSPQTSTQSKVPQHIREAHLRHVQSLAPSPPLQLPVHVVIVCWSRTYLLPQQLTWLQQQTLGTQQQRQLVVHLLSNNPSTHGDVVQAVHGFQQKQLYNNTKAGVVPLQIKIIQNTKCVWRELNTGTAALIGRAALKHFNPKSPL